MKSIQDDINKFINHHHLPIGGNKNKTKNPITTALNYEETDPQFKSLNKLFKYHSNGNIPQLTFFVIANALVCYQLSGTGEEYWDEFARYFTKLESLPNTFTDAELIMQEFLANSKNNRRFIKAKTSRLHRMQSIFSQLTTMSKVCHYYRNLYKLAELLSKEMHQNINNKTIVFAVKMFGYAGRIVYGYVQEYPKELSIPLDSRLKNLYKEALGREDFAEEMMLFYNLMASQLEIPPLHLDSILWRLYR